jgi:hypothetical protein
VELAEQVVENLSSLIQTAARPGQVVSLPALRRAMGVTLSSSPLPTPPPSGGGSAPAAAAVVMLEEEVQPATETTAEV